MARAVHDKCIIKQKHFDVSDCLLSLKEGFDYCHLEKLAIKCLFHHVLFIHNLTFGRTLEVVKIKSSSDAI